MNEPDIPQLLNWFNLPGAPAGMSIAGMMNIALANVRHELNAPQFSNLFLGDAKKKQAGLPAAHAKGKEAMKSVRSETPVGFNLAMTDDQPAPEDSHVDEKRAEVCGPWLEAAKHATTWACRRTRVRSSAKRICRPRKMRR
jgi:beta-glucosidase